jgi:hypothetical protein
MKIEKAIELLQKAQKSGTKSIVLAYWESDMFDRIDDESWESESDFLENEMDWSQAHDRMCDMLESEQEDETEEDETEEDETEIE